MVRRLVHPGRQYGSPYSQTNTYGGAQADGGFGARSNESQKNAEIQRRPGSSGAAAFGGLANAWAQRLRPAASGAQPGAPFVPEPAQSRYLASLMRETGPFVPVTGTAQPWSKQDPGGLPGGPFELPPTTGMPPDKQDPNALQPSGQFAPPPPPVDPMDNKTKGTQRTGPMRVFSMSAASTTGPPQETEATRGRIVGQPDPLPPGTNPDWYNRMVRYAGDDPRYTWLLDHSDLWGRYEQDMIDRGIHGADPSDPNFIDFTDWLEHNFMSNVYGHGFEFGPNPITNPLFKRRGYDTYDFKRLEDGSIVPREDPHAQEEPPPEEPPVVEPPVQPPTTGGEPPPVPPQLGPPPFQPPVVEPPIVEPPVTPPTTGGPPPDGTPPPGPPQFQPPVVEPPLPDEGNGGQAGEDVYSRLQGLLNPAWQREHDDLTRSARAASAVNGGYADDSGGFGANLLDAHAGLSANQGTRLSDYLTSADESARNRALQYYMTDVQDRTANRQIDVNQVIAEMNAEVQRLGITTNAQLETEKLGLERYGIDQNKLLEEYKAELQLKGQTYASDKSLDAAALQVAASKAAMSASSAHARAAAEAERLTWADRIAQQERESQRQYDLGIFGINSNIYRADIDDRYRYLYLQWLMSPESRMGSGGFPPLPVGTFTP